MEICDTQGINVPITQNMEQEQETVCVEQKKHCAAPQMKNGPLIESGYTRTRTIWLLVANNWAAATFW